MMSRISIHLKRAGDRLRDNTTLSSPNTLFFNRERRPRRPCSTQLWDHPFDPRFSADQQTPSPSPSPHPTHDDVDEPPVEIVHDPIHRPPPLVIARQPKIPDIQIV